MRAAFVEEPDFHAPPDQVMAFDDEILLQLLHFSFSISIADVITRPPILDIHPLVEISQRHSMELQSEICINVLHPPLHSVKTPLIQLLK